MATATSKATKSASNGASGLISEIVTLVQSGALDGSLELLDDAVSDRIAKHNDAKSGEKKSKTPATSKPERTVPKPTRANLTEQLSVGGKYVINSKVKDIGGSKVKFLRFRKNDTSKAVVEMLADAPGAPKGKQVVVPVQALKKAVSRRAKK